MPIMKMKTMKEIIIMMKIHTKDLEEEVELIVKECNIFIILKTLNIKVLQI